MMKNKFMMGVFALLSMLTLSLTSCDEDDDVKVANVEFSNIEVGAENSKTAVAGGDLHLECDIKSASKIKMIEVLMLEAKGSGRWHQMWTDSKYTGVLNTTFHEHLEIDSHFVPGTYHLTLTVTDVDGAKKDYTTDITLVAVDPNAPKIELVTPNENENSGVAGGKMTVKAHVTVTNPIKEIEVEFHGKGEFPVEIEDFNGKTGKIDITKEITIPAGCPAGEYHFHFTVVDSKGLKTTGEFEGFNIRSAQ